MNEYVDREGRGALIFLAGLSVTAVAVVLTVFFSWTAIT